MCRLPERCALSMERCIKDHKSCGPLSAFSVMWAVLPMNFIRSLASQPRCILVYYC